jgi:hypothetical protein
LWSVVQPVQLWAHHLVAQQKKQQAAVHLVQHGMPQVLQTLGRNQALTFNVECTRKVLRGNNPSTKQASTRSQGTCQELVKVVNWCAGLRKPITKLTQDTLFDCLRGKSNWTVKPHFEVVKSPAPL